MDLSFHQYQDIKISKYAALIMNEIVTSDVTKSQIKVQLGLCQVPRSDSKTGIYLVLETKNPPYIYIS